MLVSCNTAQVEFVVVVLSLCVYGFLVRLHRWRRRKREKRWNSRCATGLIRASNCSVVSFAFAAGSVGNLSGTDSPIWPGEGERKERKEERREEESVAQSTEWWEEDRLLGSGGVELDETCVSAVRN